MYDIAIPMEWFETTVRRVHVITAMARIGASSYFFAFGLAQHRDRPLSSGPDAGEWQALGAGCQT